MHRLRAVAPVFRTLGIVGLVSFLVSQVTFAALQSQVTLSQNTIATGTADLQIAKPRPGDQTNCANYQKQVEGFQFSGIVPGTAQSQPVSFCLKNNSPSLPMNITMFVPDVTWAVTPSGSVASDKVTMDIQCSNGQQSSTTLAEVMNGGSEFNGGQLSPGSETICTITVGMTNDAFDGEGAASSNFDIKLIGSTS